MMNIEDIKSNVRKCCHQYHVKSLDLLKETLIEVIEQKKDLFHDIVAEAIEDIAITNAIKEGESTEFTSREDVLKIKT